MSSVTVRYTPIAATKNAPAMDLEAANASLESLIRAKLEAKVGHYDLELVPAKVLDVRLSADIAKVPRLKGSLFELVGEAYEEFDAADFILG